MITQIDVKNSLFNGNLENDLFMTQPKGFVDQYRPHFMCNLRKALYGLKHVSRAWFTTLNSCLI